MPFFATCVRGLSQPVHASSSATAVGLHAKGLEKFLPLQQARRRWTDRVQGVDLPTFPGYLVCRIGMESTYGSCRRPVSGRWWVSAARRFRLPPVRSTCCKRYPGRVAEYSRGLIWRPATGSVRRNAHWRESRTFCCARRASFGWRSVWRCCSHRRRCRLAGSRSWP